MTLILEAGEKPMCDLIKSSSMAMAVIQDWSVVSCQVWMWFENGGCVLVAMRGLENSDAHQELLGARLNSR